MVTGSGYNVSMSDMEELDGRLDSILNFSIIAKLLIKHGLTNHLNMELLSTILESMFEDMQKIVDDYCVKE